MEDASAEEKPKKKKKKKKKIKKPEGDAAEQADQQNAAEDTQSGEKKTPHEQHTSVPNKEGITPSQSSRDPSKININEIKTPEGNFYIVDLVFIR